MMNILLKFPWLVIPMIDVPVLVATILIYKHVKRHDRKNHAKPPTPQEMKEFPFLMFLTVTHEPESDHRDAVKLSGPYTNMYLDAIDGINAEWKARQAQES